MVPTGRCAKGPVVFKAQFSARVTHHIVTGIHRRSHCRSVFSMFIRVLYPRDCTVGGPSLDFLREASTMPALAALVVANVNSAPVAQNRAELGVRGKGTQLSWSVESIHPTSMRM